MRENDRWAITNQLGRFARIADEKLWDALGDVFAEDVRFGASDGLEQHGLDALRDFYCKALSAFDRTQHLLGSIIVEGEGDEATSRAYAQTRLGRPAGDSLHYLDAHGEYYDRWERRSAGWKIVQRDSIWRMQVDLGGTSQSDPS